ncbi:MAG: prolipoprotein diacylglyceryl transferase [Bacteroidetes bacterium]|nr:prolipoprotein diacylglyceryl transferase [Bacteroidota bacterium]
MYPDLSYLFHALLGTAPDNWLSIFKTFGFFLAISFIASAIVFSIELKRKAREGVYQPDVVTIKEGAPAKFPEILINALVGFLLAGKGWYAYQHYETFRHEPASVILSGKLEWIPAIIGAALLGGFTWWDGQRRKKAEPVTRTVKVYPHDRISELTVWAAVGGILGAKLFDLVDNWDSFLNDPIGSLTSGGGLAFFGGLVLGFIAVVSYMYRHKIPFWPTADAVAPALATGYGMGRIGCQLSGDGDWGIVNPHPKPGWMQFLPDWMWSFTYPHHVLNTPHTDPVPSVGIENCSWDYCYQLSQAVYPTPFYEILMMSVVVGILWSLRKKFRIQGMLFFVYLALISVERFLIEKIRVNVVHEFWGIKMTQAEIISVVLFLIAVAGAIYLTQKDKSNTKSRTA